MQQQQMRFHPGLRIMYARKAAGRTQEELAEALTAASGEPWNKQKVSRLETGAQDIYWTELEVVAKVQELPITWYVDPDRLTGAIPG